MQRYDDYRESFRRHVPIRPRKAGPIIAWDVETDRIPRSPTDPMTVGLRYLTVHGANIRVSCVLDAAGSELAVRFAELFTKKNVKARFVAWNANRFDTLFLLRAIRDYLPQFAVRPFVANQAGLRGARVYRVDNPKMYWDLCDGIAMTGVMQSLAEFTAKFVPERAKLKGAIDFDKEDFDANNPSHVAYAERDSEALYLAMIEVERIMIELTGRQLQLTIGAAGIRFFERNIPDGIAIKSVPDSLWDALGDYGMRGGYVFVSRQHDGPVWQFDINQAYAAAMRDEQLPAGSAVEANEEIPGALGFYYCRIEREQRAQIPFYCKAIVNNMPLECYGDPTETFINTTEIATLRKYGWSVDVHRGWVWLESFTMRDMVDQLERLRTTDPGGTNGPVGTMVKYIGCNCYGKTTERVSAETIVISREPPDDPQWSRYRPEDPAFEGFFFTMAEEPQRRRYHRPQIGAFITAHVRMKLYDAIMEAPDAFLKADTDSVAFDAPVDSLDIHPKRYGAWKEEFVGTRMLIVGKKVYAIADGDVLRKAVCKGLNVKRLTLRDFERWIRDGTPPLQAQVQALGWSRGLGSQRYRALERRGTNFRNTAPHLFAGKGNP